MGFLFTDKISGKQYTSPGVINAGVVFLGSAAAGQFRQPGASPSDSFPGGVAFGFSPTTTATAIVNCIVRNGGVDGGGATPYVQVSFATPTVGEVYRVGGFYQVSGAQTYPLLEEN